MDQPTLKLCGRLLGPPHGAHPTRRLSSSSRSPFLQDTEDRRSANPQLLRDFLGPDPLTAQLDHFACLTLRCGYPPPILALGLGSSHALALPFQHDLPLELCETPQEVQHQLASGCARVEVHCQDLQFDILCLELRDDRDEVGHAPSQSIQLGYYQHVSLSAVVDGSFELLPPCHR